MIDSYGFQGFPRCPGHDGLIHTPAHCLTEGVLHGVVHPIVERVREPESHPTHLYHLSPELRAARRDKNARNRQRKASGNAFHVRGSQRKAARRA